MNLTRRQFASIQERLLECLARTSQPDVVSMSALAIGRVGRKRAEWVNKEAVEQMLLPLLDSDDRIVRASAALSCGMLRIEAAGEKLAFLWRNDPIKDVREGAHTAMRAVGGEVVEAKLRVEKTLSRCAPPTRSPASPRPKRVRSPIPAACTASAGDARTRAHHTPHTRRHAAPPRRHS